MRIRVVTVEKEVEFSLAELGIKVVDPSDAQLIPAVERKIDQKLENVTVTRQGENIVIAPTPVYG
jgi:hypothetical protein